MPKDITLDLECWSDDLSPAQLALCKKAEDEQNKLKKKLEELMIINDGEEIFSGELFSAYQFSGSVECPENTPINITNKKGVERFTEKQIKTEPVARSYKRRTPIPPDDDDDEDVPLAKRATRNREKNVAPKVQLIKEKKVRNTRSGEKDKVNSPSFRPSEISSIGGLTVGLDINEDNNKTGPDSKEVTFNKLQGKTFPSLVVLARPSLKVKDSSNLERNALDSKVKIVLMLTPAKFTEWLIQQGLLKSEQKCAVHADNELKLGVYSDGSKFPFSGGYVWISECCPTRFVSVFHGSLFEGAAHPPSCILKLIYHWSCQTNIQNVVQWVKVDNMYIKGVYTWLRAICTLAVHQHFQPMGGLGKYIEVGVISLGTTIQDSAQRQVKVEVLGVLDHAEKRVRLRAIEPLNDADKNYKKRFAKILEPLANWVLKDSTIVIDLTVDKSTLHGMGYKNVIQCAANDSTAKHTNSTIMDYLRRIVPRMFQNTLTLLSRQMIQQFLDELIWREQYGTFPLQTFDSITTHIAEQTKICADDTLIQRLFQVATNPFKDWSKQIIEPGPSQKKESPAQSVAPRRGRKTVVKESLLSDSFAPQINPVIDSRTQISKDADQLSKVHVSNEVEQDREYKRPQLWGSRKRSSTVVNQTVPKRSLYVYEDLLDVNKKTRTTGLEELYYGVLEGMEKNFENVTNFVVKCLICEKKFCSNLQLQIDLMKHLKTPNQEWILQCQFCLERFENDPAMHKHELLMHPNQTKVSGFLSYNCIICQNRFNSTELLDLHLRKGHHRQELPYKCGGCGYRSSSHKNAVQHFYEEHDNTNILQCPFCLFIVRIYKNGTCLEENLDSYMIHLQQHLVKHKNNKCTKCALMFLHRGLLKHHQIYDHQSFTGIPNVKRLVQSSLLVPFPRRRQIVKEEPLYTENESFGHIKLNLTPGQMCAECDTELKENNHIVGSLKCQICRYQTCCLKAMLDHISSCESNINPESSVHIHLDNEMHCVCGFSSSDGNCLARHLAVCEHKSAYPSVEAAQDNTVKRNMLDMLGLVRRDGEESESRNLDVLGAQCQLSQFN